jgi:acyl-ACP thioesterase
MNIFSEQRAIRFGSIDRSDTLTLASAFELFQDAAIRHAEILGAGRDAMKKNGQVWILSRISVFIERRPRFTDTVTVRTWPRGSYKLFAVRDYDIRCGSGQALVRGRSAWLILDMEKRRPLRPQTVMESMPANSGVNALAPGGAEDNEVPPAIAPRDFTAAPVQRRARYSDIDYNGHMNNTRYIQWIQDLMEPETLEDARQMRLDINYLSEVKPGNLLELLTMPLERAGRVTADAPLEDCPARPGAAFAIEGRCGAECVFRAELLTGV